ncbi:MAG: hypothetical protein LBI48_05945 [Burkholderiaceae bacterium]|nr:hypothetical protein [Burkholderiaceae bacterium]
MSGEIIERQNAIEQNFRSHHQQLQTLLRAAQSPNATPAQKAAFADFLKRERPHKAHLPIDFNHMPWQVQQPVKTQPAETAEALDKRLGLGANTLKSAAQPAAAPTSAQAPQKAAPPPSKPFPSPPPPTSPPRWTRSKLPPSSNCPKA